MRAILVIWESNCTFYIQLAIFSKFENHTSILTQDFEMHPELLLLLYSIAVAYPIEGSSDQVLEDIFRSCERSRMIAMEPVYLAIVIGC